MADSKSSKGPSGVSRWRAERGADSTRARKSARTGLPADARGPVAALVCAVVLVIASVVVSLPAGEVLGWGLDFAGGTSYTLVASSEDGSEASDDDVTAAASLVASRLRAMDVLGARVGASDGQITVEVPGSEDASSAVEAACMTGHLELVRVDSISDAETLARIQGGSATVTLEEGTYTALLDSSSVTAAEVVSTSTTSDTYGVTVTLDSDASEALDEATAALAPVYGEIAIVVDGEVASSLPVYQEIDGGQVTVSGGFSFEEASALASALTDGELPVGLELSETGTVDAAFGQAQIIQALVVAAVVVLAVLVALLVAWRLLGLVAYAALVACAVFEVGCVAVLSRLGLFVPSAISYAGAAVAAVVAFAGSLLVIGRLRGRVRAGSEPRDAVRGVARSLARVLLACAAVLLVGGVLVAVLAPSGETAGSLGLVWAAAVVAGALVLALVTRPLLVLAAPGMRANPGSWAVLAAPRDAS